MKKSRKMLAILLTVATVLCTMPLTVFAEGEALGKPPVTPKYAVRLVNVDDETDVVLGAEAKDAVPVEIEYVGKEIKMIGEGGCYKVQVELTEGNWTTVDSWEFKGEAGPKEATVAATDVNKKNKEGKTEYYEFKLKTVTVGSTKYDVEGKKGDFKWCINEAKLTVELNAAKGLIFNDKAQKLLNEKTPVVVKNSEGEEIVGAEVYYAISDTKPEADSELWSEDIPEAKVVGKYKVWVKVDENIVGQDKPALKGAADPVYNYEMYISDAATVVEIAAPVNTGDTSDMAPFAVLAVISLLGMAGVGLKRRAN